MRWSDAPGQPTSVRTRVVQPDTVLVSWEPPVDGGSVAGYMIGYGEGVPDVNWRYLDRYRRNVTIRNLSKENRTLVLGAYSRGRVDNEILFVRT